MLGNRRPPLSRFTAALAERNPDARGRRWLYVPYDQLSDRIGPLARQDPRRLGIILIESPEKAARRPYHKLKLALVLANQRRFALEQAERGVAVRHVVARAGFGDALGSLAREVGPIGVMRPAERELREEISPLVRAGAVEFLPHEGWLTTGELFARSAPKGPPWRMDAFYRLARRESGVLMTRDGKPSGGKFSFDVENRERWEGRPPAPDPPRFKDDPVKTEVLELVETRFARHPGRLDGASLPTSAADARILWSWALRECLPRFGPFEDAMSLRSRGLFHTRISPLLNLHRLLPREVVHDAVRARGPLPSREGFIRQVLGWREFMRHVHEATDGFRTLPGGFRPAVSTTPGDGGWGRAFGGAWRDEDTGSGRDAADGGASPSHLGARGALPAAWWGRESGLRCLDEVVRSVWEEGYSHHITRLMVLGNLATLLDVSPRELTDWFWSAYIDAYEWVVEPNVLGMATFALGDLFTTKPYVSGASYIDRMSDYCEGCAFDPRATCPITSLYWAFLTRHADTLGELPRMQLPLASARKRPPVRRRHDAAVFEGVQRGLAEGRRLDPRDLPAAEGP
jgi:deoxyribodipyrimidine photolyase-related protein